jgi:3-phosphoshikimate 1-carboxyvinyltransferase
MNPDRTVTVFPSVLEGSIDVPTSKSLTHRALIAAALAKGTSTISNVVFSDDIIATIDALRQIGAKIETNEDQVIIKGVRHIKAPQKAVDCKESGSTLRFLIPILALSNKPVTFTGAPSLLQRPLSVYESLAYQDGIRFDRTQDGIVLDASFKGGNYHIDGGISSQFFTGLMFALPLLDTDTYLTIDGTLESKSYIDLTIDLLSRYGIEIDVLENGYFIEGNQRYKPHDYTVEGDYSQAAFFLVGGILNGAITLHNLPHESLQGDREIIEFIKQMKGQIIYTEDGFTANRSSTRSATIDLSNCPDLGPIVALLGSLSKGTTRLIGASRLRLKESDRIASTVTTLSQLGANIKADGDVIVIQGKQRLQGGTVDSFNDHRIAMMAAIAALACKSPVTITRAGAVSKSYPHFFDDFVKLGGSIQ